jgi:Protein of unknown function
MTDSEIDAAILSSTNHDWKKVALVIGRTVKCLYGELSGDEEKHDRIAARIESLVAQGRLQGQGNLKRWRNSEVRCPD